MKHVLAVLGVLSVLVGLLFLVQGFSNDISTEMEFGLSALTSGIMILIVARVIELLEDILAALSDK
jgi:uncharacterized membrane protein HdeD (DUF308 family)